MGKKKMGTNMRGKGAKLLSFQAGNTSLKRPAVVLWVYQATPKPSPLVVQTDSLAE